MLTLDLEAAMSLQRVTFVRCLFFPLRVEYEMLIDSQACAIGMYSITCTKFFTLQWNALVSVLYAIYPQRKSRR